MWIHSTEPDWRLLGDLSTERRNQVCLGLISWKGCKGQPQSSEGMWLQRLCLKSLAAWFRSKDTQSVRTKTLWLFYKKQKTDITLQLVLQSCLQQLLLSVTQLYREFMLLLRRSSSRNASSDRRSAVLTFPNHPPWTVFGLKAWLE